MKIELMNYREYVEQNRTVKQEQKSDGMKRGVRGDREKTNETYEG